MGVEGRLETLFPRVQGLEESAHCAPVLLALRELLNLHDPTLLGLEVAGLRQQFPDVRYEEGDRGGAAQEDEGWADGGDIPAARIMSLPSWTCAETCPESIVRQHSVRCRPVHRLHLPPAAGHSSAWYRRLRPLCPPASPRVPAPDTHLFV